MDKPEQTFIDRLQEAVVDHEDIQLWGVGYTPLPLDLDGKPIYIDDHMMLGRDIRDLGRVWAISGETIMFEKCFEDGYSKVECFDCSRLTHYNESSEEKLLKQYGAEFLELRRKFLGGEIELAVYDRELSQLTRVYAGLIENSVRRLCRAISSN